jgi:hypothetical protein
MTAIRPLMALLTQTTQTKAREEASPALGSNLAAQRLKCPAELRRAAATTNLIRSSWI